MSTTSSSVSISGSGRARRFVGAHKVLSAIIVVAAAAGGWYWYSHATTAVAAPRYVVEKATTGTVVASVSGSGQMQAAATIQIKSQGAGNVVRIPVKVGQAVSAGQLLVQLDTTNESRALAQARLQLQSAQLSSAKLTQAPATTTLIQDQNAVTQAGSDLTNASATLAKDYQTGFDALSTTFVDSQNAMVALQNFVQGNDISKTQNDPDAYMNLLPSADVRLGASPYRDDVYAKFTAAEAAYQKNLADYHATARNAPPETLDMLFTETYHSMQTIGDAVKSVKDLLNYIVNHYPAGQGLVQLPAMTTTFQTNFGTYTNTVNSDITSISGVLNSVASDKTAFQSAQLSLIQASSSLATLLAGANPLDVQSSDLSVEQQQLAVQTAEQNLAADSLRAPVDGIVASIPAVIGASAPSPAVTMVGQGQVAQVTLNEVDAAKVKVGDKATLAFDALPDLSLAGQVVEIDPVGTVSQGVVNYNVQIALATANDRIKPGMSVSAAIVTDVRQDVIAVPNGALVRQGTATFVLEPATPLADDVLASSTGGVQLPAAPNRVAVTIGLANGTMTEITSGVSVGDQIVTRTIAGTAASAAAPAGGTNALRALGGGGAIFGGGARAGAGGAAGR